MIFDIDERAIDPDGWVFFFREVGSGYREIVRIRYSTWLEINKPTTVEIGN